jgi:acyl carrier protein
MEPHQAALIRDTPQLLAFLRQMIIESLKLEDLDPEEIREEEPLFGNGLGLDSLDALELVVAIEKNFNVVIENEDQGKEAFVSLGALARYIQREAGLTDSPEVRQQPERD